LTLFPTTKTFDLLTLKDKFHFITNTDTTSSNLIKWNLSFNVNKSKVLVVGKRVNRTKQWKLGSDLIEEVNEYKYLEGIDGFPTKLQKQGRFRYVHPSIHIKLSHLVLYTFQK
jgi:hypothetical protein